MRLRNTGLFLLLLITGLVLLSGAALAQDGVIVDGLDNPRALFYAPDGTLWVADAGRGGDVAVTGAFGPAQAGATGAVYRVAPDGSRTTFAFGLPSIANGPEILGVHDVYDSGDGTVWLLIGQGAVPGAGNPISPFSYSLVQLDAATARVLTYVDIYSHEAANDPDGQGIDSNPMKLAVGQDGAIYIADAGANSVWRWTAETGLETFHTWDDNPVPTSVAVGADGSLYVGFLTGFPFPVDGSRVERWSPAGELLETFGGLTAVVDLLVAPDGTVYAVEMATFDQGWMPNTGAVVSVSASGVTALAEGLNFPYALAISPDGTLVVSLNSAYGTAGGAVIAPLGGASGAGNSGEEAPLPAATEESS